MPLSITTVCCLRRSGPYGYTKRVFLVCHENHSVVLVAPGGLATLIMILQLSCGSEEGPLAAARSLEKLETSGPAVANHRA